MPSCVYTYIIFFLTAGSDYSNTVMNLRFSNSVQHTVVRVPIIQDAFSEGTEQFRASLSLVDRNGINVDVIPNQTIVDIVDDDGELTCK